MRTLIFLAVVMLFIQSKKTSQEAEKNTAEIKSKINEISKFIKIHCTYSAASMKSEAKNTASIKK